MKFLQTLIFKDIKNHLFHSSRIPLQTKGTVNDDAGCLWPKMCWWNLWTSLIDHNFSRYCWQHACTLAVADGWCCKKGRNHELTKEKRSRWWCFVRAIFGFNVLEIKLRKWSSIHLFWFNDNKDLNQPAAGKKASWQNTWLFDENRARHDNLFAAWCQSKCNVHQSQAPDTLYVART